MTESKHYDRKHTDRQFNIGDWVWLKLMTRTAVAISTNTEGAQPGALPGADTQGGVRAPGRARHHPLDGAPPAGLLRHVPHRQQLQEPTHRRRRRQAHRGVEDALARRGGGR